MKKETKVMRKLLLSRETLQSLDGDALIEVVAGVTGPSNCGGIPNCTQTK